MHNRLPFFALPLLAVSVAAQNTHVIPDGLANVPGSSSTAYPFGLAASSHIQYLYNAPETGLFAPIAIKAIELRAQESSANVAKSNIDLEIHMSTTSVAAAAATTTFASNRGANHTIVYKRKMTSIPASTVGFLGSYTNPLVFDTPFVYDPTAGNLLIEYSQASIPSGTWNHDVSFTATGVHASIGTGCNSFSASSTGGGVGASLTLTASGGAANAPAALLIGQTELPTPIPIPGTSCSIYQDTPLVLGLSLSNTGTGSQVVPVPNNKFLRAKILYSAWATVNGGQLSTSNTRRTIMHGVYDVARIYNLTDHTSATGSVQQSVGLVTRLDY